MLAGIGNQFSQAASSVGNSLATLAAEASANIADFWEQHSDRIQSTLTGVAVGAAIVGGCVALGVATAGLGGAVCAGAALGAVFGGALCDLEHRTAASCVTTGAIAGGVAGFTGGVAAAGGASGFTVGALSGLTGDATEQLLSTGKIDTQRLAFATLTGGALGYLGGRLAARFRAPAGSMTPARPLALPAAPRRLAIEGPPPRLAIEAPPRRPAIEPARYEFDAINNPGPLGRGLHPPAANFAGGRYNAVTLTKETTFYRAGAAGGGRAAYGRWFTSDAPVSAAQVRIDSAVKPHWVDAGTGEWQGSSPLSSVYGISFPAGTRVYTGPTGAQGSIYIGGKQQIFIPEPWAIMGHKVLWEKALR